MKKSIPKDVSGVLSTFPTASRKTLLKVRQLIFECAAADDAIGTLTETLKWGEPAYLTEQTKSGSTISCLLYTSPSPRDGLLSRMPSSA